MQMMDFDFFSSPMIFMFFMGGMGLVNIILAIFVYNDIMNQGNPNLNLWVVIVLFTSFIGAFFYFLSKSINLNTVTNNSVPGYQNQSNNKNFNNNPPFKKNILICSICENENEQGSKYCENCGLLLE